MTTTLNPADKADEVILSGGNLTATMTTNSITRCAVRATAAIGGGKTHFEVSVDDLNVSITVGLMADSDDLGSDPGRAGSGIGMLDLQFLSLINYTASNIGTNLGAPEGTVITVDVDEPNALIWFGVGGNFQVGDDPATGVGGYDISTLLAAAGAGNVYAALGCDTNNTASVVTINFGATPFAYPTSGFTGLDEVVTTWFPKAVMI